MSYDWTPERYRTGRERVNPPRSPYAYNAGHQPAHHPSCWEPPPYQPDRNPYVSRQPESHPDISYRTAPPQLREQEPPYWLNEFVAIDGEQHRRARQPWREPQLPSFADGPDPRRISLKLDRLLDRFDKLDVWREETDRRFENLEPALSRETEPPLGYEDGEEFEDDDFCQKKPWERGYRSQNPNGNFREGSSMDRGRREGRGRTSNYWDPPGNNNHRNRVSGQNPSFDRPATCWDPPQRFQSHTSECQKPPSQLLLDQPSPPSHRCSAAPLPVAAAPLPPMRSDRPPKQPSPALPTELPPSATLGAYRPQKQPDTASTIEQPPYAAPRACQPLQSLPVSAPFLASTHHPLAGVSSSRKEEWETYLHDGEEKREDKLTELNSVWNQQEKVSDSTAKREDEVNKNFPKLIEKETKAEALRASLETKEKDLSVLPEQKSTNEKMEIQCLVEEHKPAIETTKPDLKVKMDVRRSLFEDEPRLKSTELGKKGDGSYTGLPIIACVYMDLNVGDVTSMNHRPTSLDTDARLIPPRNETSCLGILRGVEKLFVLVWNFADHIGSPLLIFDGVEEGRHSVVRCVFDPGGDASPRLLLSTLYVASWFPP